MVTMAGKWLLFEGNEARTEPSQHRTVSQYFNFQLWSIFGHAERSVYMGGSL